MPDSQGNDQELFSFEELGKAFARALEGQDTRSRQNTSPEAVTPAEPLSADDVSDGATDDLPIGGHPLAADAPPPLEEDETQALPYADAVEDDGMVPVTPQAVLEAMLFVGDPQNRPLEPAVAAELMRGVTPDEVHALVHELNVKYDSQRTPWTVVMRDGGYVMQLREEFLPVRELFYGKIRQAKLSQPAIDVLAIIAYQQPLTAEEVSEIRGTPSLGILAQMVRRQLLRTKKAMRDGKSVTEYTTTPRFLQLFGLDSLGDLPRSEDLDRK